MPGLMDRIDSAVQGLDMVQLAGGVGGQIGGLGSTFSEWAQHPPGDFGSALSGLGSISLPQLSAGGDFQNTLGGLGASLQGQLGPLSGDLVAHVGSLPEMLQKQVTEALQPLFDRIAAMQALLTSDWSCGLLPVLTPPPAPVPPAPPPGAPAPPPPPPAPAPAGALTPSQVDSAKAAIDSLPADLDVPSLLRWLHERVGTFRPDYFTVRSLPVLDDIRDPLDTLVRWDDATGPALQAELTQTLTTLAAVVRTHTSGVFTRAVPPSLVASLPLAALGTAAQGYATAVEALADSVQANDAQIATRLTAVQTAQTALTTQNASLAAVSAQRTQLADGMRAAADDLDAGVCRMLVLLQPRATLADLTAPLGSLQVPEPSPQAFEPVAEVIGDLTAKLTHLLEQIDVSVVTEPLTDVFSEIDGVVSQIEQGLAQLTAMATQKLGEARSAVQSLNLDDLRQQVEDLLNQATAQVSQALAASVGAASGSLTDALHEARDAIDGIDPEALAGPINDAIDALGDLAQDEVVERLKEVLQTLSQLADKLDELSFAPVTDEVIAAIGELKSLIASIDISKLPDPGPALVGEAMKVLPQSIKPLTDPLIADLDAQLAGSPTALLEQVKLLPDQVRDRLLQFSPRQALTPVLVEPFNAAVDKLSVIQPSSWLLQADQALDGLRQSLAKQLDIAALLRPTGEAFDLILHTLDSVRPSQLIAPLSDALEQAAAKVESAVPIGDIAQAMNQALGRVRSFTATLDAALDVAEHFSQKISALGDPDAEFDAWLDGILVKVPETPAGALAAALDDVIAAARGARPAELRATWGSARQGLTDTLTAAQASSSLTRVFTARGRISGGLAALAPATRTSLQDWLALTATQTATQGLGDTGDLAVALAAADAAIEAHCAELALHFPDADGPLAPLLPTGPDRPLRDWLREAAQRQLGFPSAGFLKSLKLVGGLLEAATAALRELLQALEDKINDLLAAPVALAALLGHIADVQHRLLTLDLDVYKREVDSIYTALLDEVRALDPRSLEQPLSQARDRLIAQLSLTALLPPALRGELDAAYKELVAKIGSLDPDALLLQPLDARYAEAIQPLVDALQVGPAVQKVIDWLNSLDAQLGVEIDRVDVAYRDLLTAAPGGGGGVSGGVSL